MLRNLQGVKLGVTWPAHSVSGDGSNVKRKIEGIAKFLI
jgi:hypothetical protein